MQLLAACAYDADLAAVLMPALDWVAMPAQARQELNKPALQPLEYELGVDLPAAIN